jgi:hypothetical protein
MLLPREQSPWNCGYYLGAIALQAIKESPGDLQDLQQKMSELTKRDISPTQVIIATAWLYLVGAVELDENGVVKSCS